MYNIVCKIVIQSSQSKLFSPLLVLNILIFSDSSVYLITKYTNVINYLKKSPTNIEISKLTDCSKKLQYQSKTYI